MKTLFGFILGLSVIGLLAMKPDNDEKSNAKVDQVQGLYIFIKAKPETQYNVIGTVKGPTIGSHEFDELLLSIIKKARKEFPSAEAIVFDGPIRQTHNTTVSIIKFKE